MELKSEALKERHWKHLMKKLWVLWQLLTLGQVHMFILSILASVFLFTSPSFSIPAPLCIIFGHLCYSSPPICLSVCLSLCLSVCRLCWSQGGGSWPREKWDVKDVILVAQGEMALEEFLKQVYIHMHMNLFHTVDVYRVNIFWVSVLCFCETEVIVVERADMVPLLTSCVFFYRCERHGRLTNWRW